MKRLTALLVSTIILAGCSSSVSQQSAKAETAHITSAHIFEPKLRIILARQARIPKVIKFLKSRVGKTWYVFSGWQPTGWDCSGLTKWAYARLGYTLPHSANAQAKLGVKTMAPKPGDLVVFGYGNYFVHAAIYLGHNEVIHAGFHAGMTTSVISLRSHEFDGMKIMFRRILPIETNPVL
jgi:cell wall-associated NlpC family hydrolase